MWQEWIGPVLVIAAIAGVMSYYAIGIYRFIRDSW